MLLLSSLPLDQQARIAEILNGWNVPPEKHEEYLSVVCSRMDIALDGYFAGLGQ